MKNRQLDSLLSYCQGLVSLAGNPFHGGVVFAKVLTKNDDSGRHGVLIPAEVYEFFPTIDIQNLRVNATKKFEGFDGVVHRNQLLAYKYYQRYPERRITGLNSAFSDREHGLRVGVFFRASHKDETVGFYTDVIRQGIDSEFDALCSVLFGNSLSLDEGTFIFRTIDSPTFQFDDALADLTARFDEIHSKGWIDSLRSGDTGIGYTFETLLGIKENNDKCADFRGIEIKCKQIKESSNRCGKINLFQQAPTWAEKLSALERLQRIGQQNEHGHYRCHSQVTTMKNNIGLRLNTDKPFERIDLLQNEISLGFWPFSNLEQRLQEKHSRAVFIKAKVSNVSERQRFQYEELVYCERPSIQQFNELVDNRKIVFEFMMSEQENKKVRNHGYPWRLSNENYLNQLFSLQVKLR
ncbi:MAG: MvaI/BcnI family restriction endonuclease [Rhodocyclaceae bacterium]|nr:MvaI/BcnI family restriction endonuclease [Rhodocyclaceae bacterium]